MKEKGFNARRNGQKAQEVSQEQLTNKQEGEESGTEENLRESERRSFKSATCKHGSKSEKSRKLSAEGFNARREGDKMLQKEVKKSWQTTKEARKAQTEENLKEEASNLPCTAEAN